MAHLESAQWRSGGKMNTRGSPSKTSQKPFRPSRRPCLEYWQLARKPPALSKFGPGEGLSSGFLRAMTQSHSYSSTRPPFHVVMSVLRAKWYFQEGRKTLPHSLQALSWFLPAKMHRRRNQRLGKVVPWTTYGATQTKTLQFTRNCVLLEDETVKNTTVGY